MRTKIAFKIKSRTFFYQFQRAIIEKGKFQGNSKIECRHSKVFSFCTKNKKWTKSAIKRSINSHKLSYFTWFFKLAWTCLVSHCVYLAALAASFVLLSSLVWITLWFLSFMCFLGLTLLLLFLMLMLFLFCLVFNLFC